MRGTTRIFALIGLLLIGVAGFSQNISNKGKEFWVGYGHHQFMEPSSSGSPGSNAQNMTIYLSAEAQPAVVTLTIDSSGILPAFWWRRTYNIPAYTVISIEDVNANSFSSSAGATGSIPKGLAGQYDARLFSDPPPAGTGGAGLFRRRGIHIESSVPIVAYAHIWGSTSSGATTLIPVEAWGYEYVSINSKQQYASNCYSWMYVIASRDYTYVDITPSVVTRAQNITGLRPGQTTRVMLMKGQIYQIIGANDGADANGNGGSSSTGRELTGTTVRSVAQPGGECFPIAVFSGSSRTSNPASCGSGGGDNDNYQMYPAHAWGRTYLTAPFSTSGSASNFGTSSYKIAVQDPTTVVRRNGQVLTGLQNNNWYEFESNTADYIEADKPIAMVQFMHGGSCQPGLGDPSMVALSPIEQGIKQVGFYRNNKESIQWNYLTLIVPTAGVPSLRIDNSPAFDHSYPHPNKAGYTVVVKRWSAAKAQALVRCDSAFNAVTYGLGSVESYAYSAGANLDDLRVLSSIINTPDVPNYNLKRNAYTCVGTPVKLGVLLTMQPTRIEWFLDTLCGKVTPCANFDMNGAAPYFTDTVDVNGNKYFRYTLPGEYTFTQAGMHEFSIMVHSVGANFCNDKQRFKVFVDVRPAPVVNFQVSHPTQCTKDTVIITGPLTSLNGYTMSHWYWNYDTHDTGKDSVRVSQYVFDTGVHSIRLRAATTEGCGADTFRTITVYPPPTATFGVTPPGVCLGQDIKFSDTSNYEGTAPIKKWYWDFGNGTVIDTASGDSIIINYATANHYEVKHVVKISDLCVSDTATKIVPVSPGAVLGFTYPQGCLPASGVAEFFADSVDIGGQRIVSYLWDFGDPNADASNPNTSTDQNPTHTYTSFGDYTVTLSVVTETGCSGDTTVVISMNVQPTTTFGPIDSVCANGPVVSVANASVTNGVPGNGQYFGPGTDTLGNFDPAIAGAGQHEIQYIFVSDGGCIDTARQFITVYGVPAKPVVASPVLYCESSTAVALTATGEAGSTFTWYDDPALTNGTTTAPVPSTTNAGTLTYYVSQTSAAGCLSDTATIEVVITPVANGEISGPAAICAYDSAVVTFTPTAGTAPFDLQLAITRPDGTTDTISQTLATANDIDIEILPANSTPGTYTISIASLADSNSCVRTTGFTDINIVVNPQPVLGVTADTSICEGASVTLDATGATDYTWWPAAGLSSTTGAQVTASPTTTTTYWLNGTANGCVADSISVTVTVNPNPAKPVVTTPVTYCQDDAAVALIGTADAGNTLTWYDNPSLTGGVATAPTPSTATGGTISYFVTQTTANGCVSDTASITVVVQPEIDGNTIGADQTLCSAGAAAAITTSGTVAGGSGSYSYQWQQSTDGGTTWNDITGATSEAYSPGNLTATTVYRRFVSSGLCSHTSNEVTITVLEPFTGTGITGTQTICSGSAPTNLDGDAASAGGATVYYQWQSSIDGTTWADIAGATSEDYQSSGLTSTTWFRRGVSNSTCNAMSNEIVVTVNALPNGSINSDGSICVYDAGEVTFTALTGAAPYDVQLRVTDPTNNSYLITETVTGTAPVSIEVIAPNSDPGTYAAVIANITDDNGCDRTTGYTPVNIVVHPKPVLTVSNDAEICAGENTPLTVSGATTYTWSPANGLNTTSGNSVVANPTTTTTYTVDGSANGCTADPVQVTVTVNPVPAKPAVVRPVVYCEGETATPLSGTAVAGTLTWYDNAGLTGGSNTAPTPATTTAGTVYYYVTETSAQGCTSDTSRIAVVTNPLPLPDFQLPGATCMENGQATVQFTNSTTVPGGGGYTSVWSFGDGNSSTDRNPIHTYNAAGPHQVTLQVTTTNGCTMDVEKTLPAFLQKPVVNFSISADTICQGAPVTFSDMSTAQGSTINSWHWSFGDGATSREKDPVRVYPLPGTYTVRLSVMNAAGCQNDTSRVVRVYMQPEIDAGPSFVVPQGTTVQFMPSLRDSTEVTYQWTPATTLSNATELRPLTVVQNDLVYQLTVTGEGQCAATDTLSVKALMPIHVPNVFSPNGDGINDTWLIPHLQEYPGCTVEVYNRYGQSVYRSVGYATPWNGTLNGNPLPVGTYYYIIELKNGFSQITGSITILK